MAGVNVGTAYLEIIPSAKGFAGKLQGEVGHGMAGAAKSAAASGDKAGAGFAQFAIRHMKGIAAAAAGAFAVKAVVDYGKDSIAAFTNTTKAATGLQRAIGGTVEDASRLNFAAHESGVSQEKLAISLRLLEKATVSVGAKAAPGAKALSQMGLSAKDAHGHLLPMNSLLPDIAGKFAAMPNGAEKSALAMKLFGRSGLDMLPFLNKGKDGIADLMKESDKFGLTVGQKQADAVKKSIVAQRQWHAALEGVKVQVGAQLLPLMTKFAGMFRDRLIPVILKVTASVSKVRDAIATFLRPVTGGIKAFSAAWAAADGDVTSSGFAGYMEKLANLVRPLFDEMVGGVKAFGAAWKANDGDVTSSGFPGLMERIANGLRTAQGLAKDFIAGLTLKNADDIGAPLEGFVATGQKVRQAFESLHPSLVKVWDAAKLLWPTLKQIGKQLYDAYSSIGLSTWGLFKAALKLLPGIIDSIATALKGAAKWMSEHKTLVGAIVTAVGTALTIYKAYQAYLFIVATATKAYAAAQVIFNAVMDANPIGIIVIAIAALAAGLIYAYKNSETFRAVVDGAFKAIATVGRWLWNNVLAPVIKFILGGFGAVADKVGDFLDALSHIPGFGWAKDAADKMHGAAKKAKEFADNIKQIPDPEIDTSKADAAMTAFYAKWSGKALVVQTAAHGDVGNYRGARASGGPVRAGGAYLVGEREPELFVPNMSGTILNQSQIAGLDGGGMYAKRMHPADLAALTEASRAGASGRVGLDVLQAAVMARRR